MLHDTPPIDINVPYKDEFAVERTSSFGEMIGTFKKQKQCL